MGLGWMESYSLKENIENGVGNMLKLILMLKRQKKKHCKSKSKKNRDKDQNKVIINN